MTWTQEKTARAGLTFAIDAGSKRGQLALSESEPETLWEELKAGIGPQAWVRRAQALALDDLIDKSESRNIRFITPADAEWPSQLDDLGFVEDHQEAGGPPLGIWAIGPGNLAELAAKSVSMVGARASTEYGRSVALDLSSGLARPELLDKTGWTIISGGAYGIDAVSHQGALAVEGKTIAVMAGGLDEWYPKCNSSLLTKISETGLVISELPIGIRPTRVGFLIRNRVIAALSKATIVVEASARSGAKNTARWAMALSRLVMAVPGPVYSAMSVSTNRLIRDREAELVTNVEDVLGFISSLADPVDLPRFGESRWHDFLPEEETKVREALPRLGGIGVDEISIISGLPVPTVAAALMTLEAGGLVRESAPGLWRADW